MATKRQFPRIERELLKQQHISRSDSLNQVAILLKMHTRRIWVATELLASIYVYGDRRDRRIGHTADGLFIQR